jgi:hypothetical protein
MKLFISLPSIDTHVDKFTMLPIFRKLREHGFNCSRFTFCKNHDTAQGYIEVETFVPRSADLEQRRSALAKSLGVRFVGRPPRAGELCAL